MSRYQFSLASPADDKALRLRMQEDVMEGRIAVSFRRAPHYFAGAALQGSTTQVIKCTDSQQQRIVGLGSRSVLQVYINGQPAKAGYLSDLRGDATVRGGTLLARGYHYLKSLHDAAPVELYSTMILDGNEQALSQLTTGRAGLPRYQPLGKIYTPAIHLDRKRHYAFNQHCTVSPAMPDELPAVIEFVQQQYRRHQFAPVYQLPDVGSARLAGLSINDVYVARQGDRIVGCMGCWDQRNTRQIHIERYSPALRLFKPFYNASARLLSHKPLPAPGKRLPCLYLCWIAIHNDDPRIFRDLLERVHADKRHGPWHFLFAGLHERHKLAPELQRFRAIEAAGRLFAVHWQDGNASWNTLDNRVPHIEIAAL